MPLRLINQTPTNGIPFVGRVRPCPEPVEGFEPAIDILYWSILYICAVYYTQVSRAVNHINLVYEGVLYVVVV